MQILGKEEFRILERLKIRGPLSIDDLTLWLKKPKTAVRRVLLDLEEKQLLERNSVNLGRGRPIVQFQLGPKANAYFPSQEAAVLSELLQHLVDHGQRQLLEEFFRQFWERKFERVMSKLATRKSRDLKDRIAALHEVLGEDGFYAHSKHLKSTGGMQLRESHCPIAAVASVIDIPCRLEAELISRVLKMDCSMAEPMNARQKDCVFEFVEADSAAD